MSLSGKQEPFEELKPTKSKKESEGTFKFFEKSSWD